MGIVGRISRLSLVVEKELEPVFAQSGLNNWSFDMLATLRRTGAPYRLSPTELFRSMMVTSGTMTNRIDRLTEKELVRRVPDPEDRRGILVELTQQGRELIDRASFRPPFNRKHGVQIAITARDVNLSQTHKREHPQQTERQTRATFLDVFYTHRRLCLLSIVWLLGHP